MTGLHRSHARGTPRQDDAEQWLALARLVEPLDAARAALHHEDTTDLRRAGRDAAGLILAHCARTDRSYWAWTGWEWARLVGASAAEFRAAQTVDQQRLADHERAAWLTRRNKP